MAKVKSYQKILAHPDFDEIIGKLSIGTTPNEVFSWLKSKYSGVNEGQFVISASGLKSFKDTYLDFYEQVRNDLYKTKTAITTNTTDDLELAISGNSAYKDALTKIAKGELDVETMMARLALNIETRLGQIFDQIQNEPDNINIKLDRMVNEYSVTLGNMLEKYYRWKEPVAGPNSVSITNNFTMSQVNQHIGTFQDVIKEVLAQMDLETSLYFMEVFNDKMSKLKMPIPEAPVPTEIKLAETKLLNEKINQTINS